MNAAYPYVARVCVLFYTRDLRRFMAHGIGDSQPFSAFLAFDCVSACLDSAAVPLPVGEAPLS